MKRNFEIAEWIGPLRDGKEYGFINPAGEWILRTPYQVGPFHEGLAAFVAEGKMGFLEQQGELRIEAQFDSDYAEFPYFNEGVAPVQIDGNGAFIDGKGAVLYGRHPNSIGWSFVHGKAIWANTEGYSILDREWRTLAKLPDAIDDIPYLNAFPQDWDFFPCFMAGFKCAYISWKGEVVFPPLYAALGSFYEGVAPFSPVEQFGPHGLVALDGKVVAEPIFLSIGGFECGLAPAAKEKKKWGYINSKGEWAIPPIYEQALSFADGLACVTVPSKKPRGRTGFINPAGEMVIEPRFDRQASFSDGWAVVEFEGKEGVIDRTGTVIWSRPI